jgi:hypothetical protein
MDSRRDETNLTSKFKMQGPNTSKRIMATIGPRKGRNQVLEGSQDFICSHTWVETWVSRDCSWSHLACWRMWSARSSTMPEVFICVQQEVLAMAHTPLAWPKENLGPGGGPWPYRQGRQRPLHVLNGKAYLVWVSSTTLVRFFAVTWLAIIP